MIFGYLWQQKSGEIAVIVTACFVFIQLFVLIIQRPTNHRALTYVTYESWAAFSHSLLFVVCLYDYIIVVDNGGKPSWFVMDTHLKFKLYLQSWRVTYSSYKSHDLPLATGTWTDDVIMPSSDDRHLGAWRHRAFHWRPDPRRLMSSRLPLVTGTWTHDVIMHVQTLSKITFISQNTSSSIDASQATRNLTIHCL